MFVPNIFIMFIMLSLLEDTGYLARAAFIMDRLMSKIGLHGKSFIPMLLGLGCNVPAIMATRTIEDPKSRLITILTSPYISCSARLPVYVLFAGIIFPRDAGTVVFVIYLLGIAVAIVSALALRKTLLRGEGTPYIMELPPYRVPSAKSTVIHMWEKAMYIVRLGLSSSRCGHDLGTGKPALGRRVRRRGKLRWLPRPLTGPAVRSSGV